MRIDHTAQKRRTTGNIARITVGLDPAADRKGGSVFERNDQAAHAPKANHFTVNGLA